MWAIVVGSSSHLLCRTERDAVMAEGVEDHGGGSESSSTRGREGGKGDDEEPSARHKGKRGAFQWRLPTHSPCHTQHTHTLATHALTAHAPKVRKKQEWGLVLRAQRELLDHALGLR